MLIGVVEQAMGVDAVRTELAMVGLKSALQSQQVLAEVVTNAANAVKETGKAAQTPPSPLETRGSLLDKSV